MLLLTETVPFTVADELQDGDVLFYPSGEKLFRLGELSDDGAWGGDICESDYPDCALEWAWLTIDEMLALGLRRARGGTDSRRH